jgi:hypothetical protein
MKSLTLEPDFVAEMRRHVNVAVDVEQAAERSARARLTAQLKKLETQEANLIDVAADGELATTAVKERLRDIAIQRRNIIDKLSRSEEQARRQADTVLAYLDLLSRPYSFYVASDDTIKRKILEAFFIRIWLEDDEQGILARIEVHEPIVLIQADAAEWARTSTKSAGNLRRSG